jgi:hypothetical protein
MDNNGPQLEGISPGAFEKSRLEHDSELGREEEDEGSRQRFWFLVEGMFSIDLGWESEDIDGGIGYEEFWMMNVC